MRGAVAGTDRDDRDTALVATASMAVVLAGIYWISRIGFANPAAPVLNALGVSLFLCATPSWLARMLDRSELQTVWLSEPLLGLICIGLTVLAGSIAFITGVSAVLFFTAAGLVLTLITASAWLRRGRTGRTLLFLACVAVFAVWCAGVIWGSRYKMPLFWETLAYKANIHHDTFYYGSMANMLETYGVPSTGIDGLPTIRYHFGSPWLFAKWAHLTGVDVLTFYSLGYPVIVLPLFFSSLFGLTRAVRLQGSPLRGDWRAGVVFLAATVGFIPTRALDAFAIWNSNAFISESYLIGMPVFLMVLSSGLYFWKGKGAGGFSVRDAPYLMLLLPVMLVVAGFLKISLMVLLLGVMLYLIVRLKLWRHPVVVASAVVSVLAVALTYRVVSLPDQNGGFSPFHFMRFDAAEGWQQFFPLFHLLWTWVYIAGRMWEERIANLGQLRGAFAARRLVDVEVLLAIALLGFIPGEIVSVHGGSAVYFSDVQRWVALAFMMARVGQWADEWKVRHPPRQPLATERGWRGVRLSRLLAVFVLAPFAATLFVNLAQWPLRVLRANVTFRHELAEQGGVERSAYYPIVTALREIDRLPRDQKRRTALFIPQSNTQYWSMFTSDNRCSWTPLIAPAVTGVAMIDGMPPPGCEMTDQYNMPLYVRRAAAQTPSDTADLVLCKRATAKGFREVMVLDAPPVGRRRIDCYLH